MAYLTYTEYNEIGYTSMTEDEFDELVNKACDLVDVQTRNFISSTF